MVTLPTDIDSSYADDGSDASVQAHQQHHDVIHNHVNASQELAYAEINTDWSTTTTANDATNDITGLDITFDADGSTPIILEAWCMASINSSSAVGYVSILDENNNDLAWSFLHPSVVDGNALGGVAALSIRRRIVPSVGIRTYKARARIITGSATLLIDTGADTANPAFIRAIGVDVA